LNSPSAHAFTSIPNPPDLFSCPETTTCHSAVKQGPENMCAALSSDAETGPESSCESALPESTTKPLEIPVFQKKLKRSNSSDLFEFCIQSSLSKTTLSDDYASLLTSHQIQFIFTQLCQAIFYLHQTHNLAHLDLKDENIVINESLKIKLIDFGSARFLCLGDPPELVDFKGSLRFAPPEVLQTILPFNFADARKGFAGKPVDMWSLGLLLHLLVFSSLPFDSHTHLIRYSQSHSSYSLPCSKNPILEEIQDLLHGLLDFDPDSRWTIQDVFDHPWISSCI
jgi:serine/threonine protein kinase